MVESDTHGCLKYRKVSNGYRVPFNKSLTLLRKSGGRGGWDYVRARRQEEGIGMQLLKRKLKFYVLMYSKYFMSPSKEGTILCIHLS